MRGLPGAGVMSRPAASTTMAASSPPRSIEPTSYGVLAVTSATVTYLLPSTYKRSEQNSWKALWCETSRSSVSE
jgi:hypothetical protein